MMILTKIGIFLLLFVCLSIQVQKTAKEHMERLFEKRKKQKNSSRRMRGEREGKDSATVNLKIQMPVQFYNFIILTFHLIYNHIYTQTMSFTNLWLCKHLPIDIYSTLKNQEGCSVASLTAFYIRTFHFKCVSECILFCCIFD